MTDDAALLLVAPELAAVDPIRRQFFIDAIKPNVLPRLGQYGLALAVAHALTLMQRNAPTGGAVAVSGPVTSEKEGELSRTYADMAKSTDSNTSAYWWQTPYGQQYWELIISSTLMARNRMVR